MNLLDRLRAARQFRLLDRRLAEAGIPKRAFYTLLDLAATGDPKAKAVVHDVIDVLNFRTATKDLRAALAKVQEHISAP